MGMLSSWVAFSIAHHIIINFCKRNKSFYAVIGDDVGMSSKEGAMKYRSLMETLGVSINDEKSLIPNESNRVAEIAKRQFKQGDEISAIPPRVLIEATKGLEGLLEFLQVAAVRTGKLRPFSSELEMEGIRSMIKRNRDFLTDQFQVTITCPLDKYNPFQVYLNLLAPFRVTGRWNTSMPVKTFIHEMERYILNIAVMAINQHPLSLELFGMPAGAPRSSNSPVTPLITNYLAIRKEALKKLLKVTLAHQGTDDWDDDHVVSSESIYEELLSGPNPYSPKDFMEKRRIRRKASLELIYKFYGVSRFAKARKGLVSSGN
jgi:hypothetical protein